MVEHNVHRIPIIRGDGEIVDIIPQRKVVQFISLHEDKFPILLRSIEDVNIRMKEVLSISHTSSILDGFKIISSKKVTAVAVLNDKGDLIGEIDSSDSKELDDNLTISAKEFLIKRPNRELHTLSPECYVKDVVNKFIKSHAHRIYLVENNKPVGIISLIDILSALKSTVNRESTF